MDRHEEPDYQGDIEMPKEGNKAPAFTLPDQDGVAVSLKEFTGSLLVLFFFPKANTGG